MSDKGSRGLALAALSLISRTRKASAAELRDAASGRILVVRQDDRIGNLLFITPLLRSLKQRIPGSRIDVAVSSRFPEVLAHNPCVDGLVHVDRRRYRKAPHEAAAALRSLRRHRYDLVIDCKPGPSLSNALVVLGARSIYRLGFGHEHARAMYSLAVPKTGFAGKHETARLHTLIDAVWGGGACPAMEFHFPEGCGPGRSGASQPDGVAIHIGGHGKKRIPPDVLVRSIESIRKANISLELLAGPEERDVADRLTGRIRDLCIVFPKDIVHLAERIAAARCFITPDTGALHIASALDVPTANLCATAESPTFGPLSSRRVVVDFHDAEAIPKVMAFLEETVTPSS